ncbi:sensor histidine kinase [Streptomyces violascens]|uniref:sensor histidine kinase n=1 Tax=Streptomyces violascens TaxID=67381 RepID=UPI001672DABA|nr:sensor histidine kinase [Streptomyces violascens]
MKKGDAEHGRGVRRLTVAGLRGVPRTLRQDLLSASGPQPRGEQQGWLLWRPALAVPLLMISVFLLVAGSVEYSRRFHLGMTAGVVLAGVQAGALVAALYRPRTAWWTTTGVTVVAALGAEPRADPDALYPWSTVGIAVTSGVLLLVALTHRPRVAVETLVISLAAGVLCSLLHTRPHNSPSAGLAFVCFSIAVVVGAALRGRRVARTQLVVQEEITAEERARRTLLEERSRIARELHDVVAHHMSVISIQAQVAPHLVENPSEELKENLAGIRQNAVEALTELRRVLGVLRSEDPVAEGAVPGAVGAGARHAPQPSLERLDELVANVRGAGVPVTADVVGTARALSPGVELSAFRIVQEALSNAMRHAPGAAVRVVVAHHRAELVVRVTNTAPDRPVAPSPGAGHGLLGMRERAAMLGGELAVGATADGGYEVTATLPLNTPVPNTSPPKGNPS